MRHARQPDAPDERPRPSEKMAALAAFSGVGLGCGMVVAMYADGAAFLGAYQFLWVAGATGALLGWLLSRARGPHANSSRNTA